MLYLIKAAYLDSNDNPQKCLKIGYTDNLESRLIQYGTHNNANVILLGTREGSIVVEGLFHQYYKDKILKIKGNREWIEFDEKIIQEFESIEFKDLLLNVFSKIDDKRSIFGKIIIESLYRTEEDIPIIVNLFNSCKREYSIIGDYLDCPIYTSEDFEELSDNLISLFQVFTNIEETKKIITESLCDVFSKELISIPKNKKNLESLFTDDDNQELIERLNSVQEIFKSKGSFEHKMKLVCDFLLDPKWYGKIYISDFYWLPLNYRNYLNLIGPERIRANGYIEADIKKEISLLGCGDILKSEVIKLFNPGSWYSSKNIKQKLGDLYKYQSILRTPKATDILDFFEVKEYLGLDKETGKRSRGYEIIKIKE